MPKLIIDRAQPADLERIAAILNDAIANTAAVWFDAPRTLPEVAAWLDERSKQGQPFLVARQGKDVVGFTTYGQFRPWPGYRHSVELSIFVDAAHRRRGIGRNLIEALVLAAKTAGMHAIVAGVEATNEASLQLHQQLGFVEVGRLPEVGRKFDRWLTLVFLQRLL